MKELQQLAQGHLRPLGHDAHGAIGQVGNPADEVQPLCFLPGVLSEVDPLHETVDGGFQSSQWRR